MAEPTDTAVNVQSPDAGRVLTSDEALFLQQYLLSTETVVVVGRDNGEKPLAQKGSLK